MRFRPCIDIHNGKVKQIVGGSLKDRGDKAAVNFTSEFDSTYYAKLYKRDGLRGGHVILLNPASSRYYEATREQALKALAAYPGGMQIGGGITAENAQSYMEAGASHVIVTSYVFQGGEVRRENLKKLVQAVGREHIVLDVSCRRKGEEYYIVTDRWQTFTGIRLTPEVFFSLSKYCDEFLVHGVDVEGKASGADEGLLKILAEYASEEHRNAVTYAGGIGTLEDLDDFCRASKGKIDFTVGSALDLFGGSLSYEAVKNLR